MNDRLLWGISFAGLFHDIGKFAERAYAVENSDPDNRRSRGEANGVFTLINIQIAI